MNILVTGGAGFIGSKLLSALVKEHDVMLLDNLHTGNMNNLNNIKLTFRRSLSIFHNFY
ncbi:MAG: NAD-dependent epimerase/dehydratase family protein [Methanosarcinales archaeon]|nr:MAG: NAD-dependent epimerase/dehydratase family protein [Methanosarcinales archaeon]